MCILIDVAVPADEGRKYIKCNNLCVEKQGMWNMKYMVTTVVTGATGIVTKGLKKNLQAKPGKHSL
jgi:hypothetical protein